MRDVQRFLEYYVKAVRFPVVSGFEVLELLDMRSRLPAREHELDVRQRAQLEDADSVFLRHAPTLYESLAGLGDLGDVRRRAAAPCSHWWWYLDRLVQEHSQRSSTPASDA